MPTIKFACENCDKLMAVGRELSGHRVRCPHCEAVVVAPVGIHSAGPPITEPDLRVHTERIESPRGGAGRPAGSSRVSPTERAYFELPATEATDLGQLAAAIAASGPNVDLQPAHDQPSRYSRPSTSISTMSRTTTLALSILIPYAIFMTVVAITYYMKFESAKQVSPLEMIPDLLGEFRNKQSKGSTSQSLRLPKPDQKLPTSLTTTLGRPITVGDIEVTPVEITQEPVVVFEKEKGKDEPERREFPNEHLVLHLKLRNVSPELTFFPSDPFFTRRPKTPSDRPYAMVEVSNERFYGGLVEYSVEPGRIERTWVAGQENDHLPLRPGESRTTVVVTHPKDSVIAAVNSAKSPALWRVHVRRGMVPYRDTEVPASCVIGVRFSASHVRKAA